MSYASVVISGAASLGVLIALLSGIFFLVLTALKWVSRVREALYEEELRQQKKTIFTNAKPIDPEFLEIRKAENGFRVGAISESHSERKSENFQSNAGNAMKRNENQTEEKTSGKQEPTSDTIKVREFIEKMVEKLIGGSLDGTTVGQLSSHSACKRALEPDSSNFSQCNLKRLLKRIVSEAMALPDIKDILCKPKTVKEAASDDFRNKSYEDVLATAILNKVIEHFQNRENETTDYKPKPRPRSKKPNPDDDDQKSNSDWSDVSRSDQLSLTIEEYIEEVTTALEASEDDRSDVSDFETNVNRRIPFPEAGRTVVDAGTDAENSDDEGQSSATELFTSTSSWEENWLFQKKRLRSTPNAHHPVPVPMLVPNPSEDYRALVGGVDADDLSDMSDCSDLILEDSNAEKKTFARLSNEEVPCNDAAEELDENENKKDKQFGAKENSPGIMEESDANLVEDENGRRALESEDECKKEEEEEEEISLGVKSNSSPTSPSQKDREFSVEDFELLQQCESYTGTTSIGSESGSTRSRIAEREKEKWNNPVPLADNPYSLENIERRAQRKRNEFFRIGTYTGESIDFPEDLSSDELTKSNENLRFTRDYYINSSKNPSGRHPSSLNRHSKGHEQVSRHSCEAFPSFGRRNSEKRSNPKLYLIREFNNIAEDATSFFPTEVESSFSALKYQTMKSQHFSNVFRSNYLTDPPKLKTYGKYRYGSHSLKLRPKSKEPLSRQFSVEEKLSDFERKTLREDVAHSLLRAKGASPNFILNPVYRPDVRSGQAELSNVSPCDRLCAERERYSDDKAGDSEVEPEFGKSEPIVPRYRRMPDPGCGNSNRGSRISQESGYGSDSLDYSSDSLEFWRLTPPKTPEVVESSFVSIANNRKSSLRRSRSSLSDFY